MAMSRNVKEQMLAICRKQRLHNLGLHSYSHNINLLYDSDHESSPA